MVLKSLFRCMLNRALTENAEPEQLQIFPGKTAKHSQNNIIGFLGCIWLRFTINSWEVQNIPVLKVWNDSLT